MLTDRFSKQLIKDVCALFTSPHTFKLNWDFSEMQWVETWLTAKLQSWSELYGRNTKTQLHFLVWWCHREQSTYSPVLLRHHRLSLTSCSNYTNTTKYAPSLLDVHNSRLMVLLVTKTFDTISIRCCWATNPGCERSSNIKAKISFCLFQWAASLSPSSLQSVSIYWLAFS